MCVICVNIARERITVREGLEAFNEVIGTPTTNDNNSQDHAYEIIQADRAGDVDKVKRLVLEGYKKERWL